jgi:hypothetical protein
MDQTVVIKRSENGYVLYEGDSTNPAYVTTGVAGVAKFLKNKFGVKNPRKGPGRPKKKA